MTTIIIDNKEISVLFYQIYNHNFKYLLDNSCLFITSELLCEGIYDYHNNNLLLHRESGANISAIYYSYPYNIVNISTNKICETLCELRQLKLELKEKNDKIEKLTLELKLAKEFETNTLEHVSIYKDFMNQYLNLLE